MKPTCIPLVLISSLTLVLAAPLCGQTLRIVADPVSPTSVLEARVGDRLDLQIVADVGSITATGLALHLSVPDGAFDVVDTKPAAQGATPFTPGSLFSAVALRNAVLAESDPVAAATPGWQLDYAAVLGPTGGRPITGAGVVATFSVRCLAPTKSARIAFDDNPVRETRLLAGHGAAAERRFRALEGIDIRVSDSALAAVQPSGWGDFKRTASAFGAAKR